MTALGLLVQQFDEVRDGVRALPRIDNWCTLPLPPNVGLWEWRPPSSHVRLSAAWAGLLGIDEPDQAVRLSEYVEHAHPDDRPLLTLALVNFLVSRGEYVSRHRMMHGDGSERQFVSRSVLVLPECGQPARVVVADFDLTGASC